MNGNRFMFDTNAIISFLKGNSSINNILLNSSWIATSVITFIEFLSFSNLDEGDKELFYKLISRITLIPVSDKDKNFFNSIAEIRKAAKVKLPDAIIAASAISNNAILITNVKGFSKISLLKTVNF